MWVCAALLTHCVNRRNRLVSSVIHFVKSLKPAYSEADTGDIAEMLLLAKAECPPCQSLNRNGWPGAQMLVRIPILNVLNQRLKAQNPEWGISASRA